MTDPASMHPLLRPDYSKSLPYARALNIAFRTIHIVAMSLLVGGYAFGASAERLRLSLLFVLGSGAALILIEAYPNLHYIFEGRALFLWFKLALFGILPHARGYQVPILLLIVAIASVGSHLPSRYRHFSVLYRRVVKD